MKISRKQRVPPVDCDSFFAYCGLVINHCYEEHPCPPYKKFKGIRDELVYMLKNTNFEEMALDIKSGESFLM